MVGCIHYQSSYRTHSDSQLIKKFLLGWCAPCYIASAHGMFAFNLFHVSHHFKIIAHFRLQVNPFLIIIFVESALRGPIFKALFDLNNSVNVTCCCRAVNLACVILVNHFLLGCPKRVGVTHHAIDPCEAVVARVCRVALHLKGDV